MNRAFFPGTAMLTDNQVLAIPASCWNVTLRQAKGLEGDCRVTALEADFAGRRIKLYQREALAGNTGKIESLVSTSPGSSSDRLYAQVARNIEADLNNELRHLSRTLPLAIHRTSANDWRCGPDSSFAGGNFEIAERQESFHAISRCIEGYHARLPKTGAEVLARRMEDGRLEVTLATGCGDFHKTLKLHGEYAEQIFQTIAAVAKQARQIA